MSHIFGVDAKLAALAALLIAGALLSLCPLSKQCPLVRMASRKMGIDRAARPDVSAPSAPLQSPSETPRIADTNPPEGVPSMSTLESKPRSPGRVVHADLETFEQIVLESEIPVLVDFYADWCRPCQLLSPILEELARELPDAKIVKVNVDDSRQLAGHFGVSSIPALMVFKDGKLVDSRFGLVDKASLKQMLGS